MIQSAALVASISRNAGGLFESVRRLCQSLHAASVGVEVLSCFDQNTHLDLPQWQPLMPRVFAVLGPRPFGYAPGLLELLLHLNPDVLHLHGIWMYPSVATLCWAKKTKRPLVLSAHGMLDPWAYSNSRWKKITASFLYESSNLRRTSCMRALCAAEAVSFRRLGLTNPICIIPNGVDIPQAVLDAPPPWRSKLCNDKKVLLYLGRIHPKKGLLNLLAALDIVRKKGSRNIASWVVALAGWDQLGHEGELKRRVKDLGLDEKVIFLGPQFAAQKVACYASADAFVLPSLSEGLPMVVLEAWAHGLPVLMTAECNIPEGFEAGAAIPIEASPERIASGLQTLFSMTDAERKDSGLRGLALVTDRFAWPRIAEDMKAVYEWLVGGGVRPSCVSQE